MQMKEMYTATIVLAIFSMGIMLLAAHDGITKNTRQTRYLRVLYMVIMLCAICEWSGVMLDGTKPSLIPLHCIVKVVELSIAPLIGVVAGTVIHKSPKFIMRAVMVFAFLHALLITISARTGYIFYVDADNVYHHGSHYFLYSIAYGLSAVFFLVQVYIASLTYQFSGSKQLVWATFFVVAGLLTQLFFPSIKIDWITIAIATLMLSKFSSDMLFLTDGLTELLNHRGYDHFLERLHGPAVFILLDIDLFKDVNDKHGHQAGDICLQTVAACIRKAYGAHGLCFRTGGDEFCVAVLRRRNQYASMTTHFLGLITAARQENPTIPTVSYGYAYYFPGGDDKAEVLAKADAMLYAYKEQHR